MRPSCVRPWWIQPSTCFSSKWRVNWNRLKTNWSRPKMNWVPGNLHLIGKDNQNNSPLQNKTKKSRFPHAPHPHSHCRHAGTIVGEKGWHMPYSPRDSDFTESQSLQNKPLFVLLHCASYITHNLTWKKDSMVRWHLCFSSHRPRAWRSPDYFQKRWSLTFPNMDMPLSPQPKADSLHINWGGVMMEVELGGETP